MRNGVLRSWRPWSCALCLLAIACASSASRPAEPDAAALDNPVDEFGFSVVGENIYPPLYQRVEPKCVSAVPGLAAECTADDDCGAGFACICGHQQGRSLGNQCVPAECRSSADCGGGKCLLSIGSQNEECCEGHLGLVCSRSASTCHHGGDCPGNGIACIYDTDLDYFECKLFDCACGS